MGTDLHNSKPVSAGRRIFYGWYLVAAAWPLAFLTYAAAPALFFKPLLDQFHTDRATLSLVSSATLLIFAAISPFLGRLIDRFGPRSILLTTAGAQILNNVLTGLAQGLGWIFAGQLFYQLKATHSTQVLVNRWFIKKRGRALGILSTSSPLGQLLLSPVTQLLIISWSWRPTLFFWAGMVAVFTIPVAILVRTSPRDKGLQSDGEPEDGLSAPAAAAAGSTESGASLGEALHSRPFWLIIAAHLICGITCGLLATHTVIFATDLGYSAIIGASFLSVQGGVGLLGVMVTGVLSDRLARNKVLSMTHLIRSLAMLLLVIAIISGGTLWLLYLAMALFGFGWFTTSPLVGGLVADLFGNLRMGTILGVVLSSHMVGMAIGAYAGGLCYQLTGSYRDVFIMTAALEMTACICAFLIKNPGWRRAPASPD